MGEGREEGKEAAGTISAAINSTGGGDVVRSPPVSISEAAASTPPSPGGCNDGEATNATEVAGCGNEDVAPGTVTGADSETEAAASTSSWAGGCEEGPPATGTEASGSGGTEATSDSESSGPEAA
jgi:hypothetical protein